MPTIMYLLRHGATAANLSRPSVLQGRKQNPPLAALGIRQAELTRDYLAIRPIEACYCSPLRRAVETATIIASAHDLVPQPLEALTECDVGAWEGLDWQTIRRNDPEAYRRYMANPAQHGYPRGESFDEVFQRAAPVLEALLERHAGESILVVAHHVVNRTYLASLLGMTPAQGRQVSLDNCGISVIVREGEQTRVGTLNAAFHLQGAAA
jgi:broad specificity phosphatase PhoE